MSYGITDSILAISTPSGQSLRAIIRLSGKDVLNLLKSVFIPDDCGGVSLEKGFNSYRGNLYLDREKVRVPVYIYIMRSPNSYTREDVVEIHTFGSPPLLEMLMETLLSSLKEDGSNENKIEDYKRYKNCGTWRIYQKGIPEWKNKPCRSRIGNTYNTFPNRFGIVNSSFKPQRKID